LDSGAFSFCNTPKCFSYLSERHYDDKGFHATFNAFFVLFSQASWTARAVYADDEKGKLGRLQSRKVHSQLFHASLRLVCYKI